MSEVTKSLSDYLCDNNVDKKDAVNIAKQLISYDWPVINNLLINKLPNDQKVKCLAALIVSECCLKKVPLYLFCEGAWRPGVNNRVGYHSHYALGIWKHLAKVNNLPTIKEYHIKYVLQDKHYIHTVQPLYRMLRTLVLNGIRNTEIIDKEIEKFLKKSPEHEEIENAINVSHIKNYSKCRFIILNSDKIYDWDFEPNKSVVVMCGQYEICGAHGHIVDSNGKIFEFEHEISFMQTKLTVSGGERESAFAKNPIGFITTKFQRHATEAYYKLADPENAIITQDEDDDYILLSGTDTALEEAQQLRTEDIASRITDNNTLQKLSINDIIISKDDDVVMDSDADDFEGTN